MTLLSAPKVRARRGSPTIWGHTPYQVHDRFWAGFGVQVVRLGETTEIADGAELFLLCEPNTLVIFEPAQVLDAMTWLDPDLLMLRVRDNRSRAYREIAVTDSQDRFVRIRRIYGDDEHGLTRVALTTHAGYAMLWQSAPDRRTAWRQLRRQIPRQRRSAHVVEGHLYDGADDRETMQCVQDLIARWRRPGSTIGRAVRAGKGVWADLRAHVSSTARFAGPVWVGAGRKLPDGAYVVGPAVLWDNPDDRPEVQHLEWGRISPSKLSNRKSADALPRQRELIGKRLFDILFSLTVLLLTLPLYPIVAVAILLEDGWPVFFAHRRETLGGAEFPCWKFRSMRKDADSIKHELETENQADGPQFFIDPSRDPRLTRVGRFIRKTQIDELPQFLNVLLGHMSIVGPRPSPRGENQYCPTWREIRLSIRPGLTGLWQVKRTRERGKDFQEWIKFDLEYAEQRTWALDLWIVWKTVLLLIPGRG